MTQEREQELVWMAQNYDMRARKEDDRTRAFKALGEYRAATRSKTLADGLWQAKVICLKAIEKGE
jgi:hypothetical protein